MITISTRIQRIIATSIFVWRLNLCQSSIVVLCALLCTIVKDCHPQLLLLLLVVISEAWKRPNYWNAQHSYSSEKLANEQPVSQLWKSQQILLVFVCFWYGSGSTYHWIYVHKRLAMHIIIMMFWICMNHVFYLQLILSTTTSINFSWPPAATTTTTAAPAAAVAVAHLNLFTRNLLFEFK